jgi:septal ring factor EnvC (AmiA/AmiB activator)
MEITKEYFDQQLGNLATKGDLERLASKEDLNALKIDVSELKGDVSELKSDVTGLKTDMQSVKTDIVALQDDMRSVKSTLQEMNKTLSALDKRDREDSDAFAKTLVKHNERLNVVEGDIKSLKLKQA